MNALVYQAVARQFPKHRLAFMNYGFAPQADEFDCVQPADHDARYHLALVRRVLEGVELDGRSVLEIGCGRGGNCDYLGRYTAARPIYGLDVCAANLNAGVPTAAFLACGNAQALPIRSSSVHVVLNIESSHCYPEFEVFLAEVRRVLKPGGRFCYADLWGLPLLPYDWNLRARQLRSCGLRVLWEEDISDGVYSALKQADGFSALIAGCRTGSNDDLVSTLIQGNYAMRLALASRQCTYKRWVFEKPGTWA